MGFMANVVSTFSGREFAAAFNRGTSIVKRVILAAAIVFAGATAAAAQFGPPGGPRPDQRRFVPPPPPPVIAPWKQSEYGHSRWRHRACVEKAWRLREFDRHAASDGWFSPREKRTHDSLKYDLDRTCGGFRWRG
jgi:hypothetical protein